MTQVFKFRYRGAGGRGGLAVDLRAEAVPLDDVIPPHSMQIYKKVWLGLPASGLHWKDAAWLAFGISINAPALSELLPAGVFVRTSSLDYPLSDYRSEAAALAMDGWLHDQFDMESSGAAVTYEAIQDKLAFTWGDTALPFSDAPH
ncbi:hypothetical protein G3I76_04470 [Streptomyces sp. SID11233]|nr:hypothetical protein [Streptomyces sp. SID11233]